MSAVACGCQQTSLGAGVTGTLMLPEYDWGCISAGKVLACLPTAQGFMSATWTHRMAHACDPGSLEAKTRAGEAQGQWSAPYRVWPEWAMWETRKLAVWTASWLTIHEQEMHLPECSLPGIQVLCGCLWDLIWWFLFDYLRNDMTCNNLWCCWRKNVQKARAVGCPDPPYRRHGPLDVRTHHATFSAEYSEQPGMQVFWLWFQVLLWLSKRWEIFNPSVILLVPRHRGHCYYSIFTD